MGDEEGKTVYVLIILTLTFIQSHTDLNYENKKCLIISEIKLAVKIVPLKVYMTIASAMTLASIQGHKCISN